MFGRSSAEADWNVPTTEPSRESPLHQLELFVHPIDAGEDAAGEFEHHPPCGRQLRGSWSRLAIEQRDACGPLQLTDLLADRRLREAESFGRCGECSGLDDRDERRHLAWVGVTERHW